MTLKARITPTRPAPLPTHVAGHVARFAAAAAILLGGEEHARAADRVQPLKRTVEISVKLFSGDCKLSGPWDAAVLTRIHAIGPERIPPQQPLEPSREAVKLLQASTDIPNALDLYRERLLKRVEQQVRFHEAVPAAKKAKSLVPIREALIKQLNAVEKERLEATLRMVSNKELKVAKWDVAFIEKLTTALDGVLEPYPEEDYHRTIQRLGLKYDCVSELYEDDVEAESSDPAPTPSATPSAKK